MFRERLKQIRDMRELTQSDLGAMVGLDLNTISRYETGKTEPSADIIALLARALDVSADYLLGLKDDPRGRPETRDLTPDQRKLLFAHETGNVVVLLQIATKIAEQTISNATNAEHIS